jgi:hypothetical protein
VPTIPKFHDIYVIMQARTIHLGVRHSASSIETKCHGNAQRNTTSVL